MSFTFSKINQNPAPYPGQPGAALQAKTTANLAASGSAGDHVIIPAGIGLCQLANGVNLQQLDSDGATWQTIHAGSAVAQGGVYFSDGTNTRFQNTSGAAVSGTIYWPAK